MAADARTGFCTANSAVDAADAERRIAVANQRVKASLGALSGPLPPELVQGLLAQQRAFAGQFDAPEEMFVQSINRALRRENEATFMRPSPTGLGAEILAAAETFAPLTKLDADVRVVCGDSLKVTPKASRRPSPTEARELLGEERPDPARELLGMLERQAVAYFLSAPIAAQPSNVCLVMCTI
jgi:hypothetical protein